MKRNEVKIDRAVRPCNHRMQVAFLEASLQSRTRTALLVRSRMTCGNCLDGNRNRCPKENEQ